MYTNRLKTWVHKIIKNKQQNKKPCYFWRLLRHQLIQKIDKAKTTKTRIYPIFPVWTLFQSNQKLEEIFFFIDEKVNKQRMTELENDCFVTPNEIIGATVINDY